MNKVAFITGASRGIGKSIAIGLSKTGMSVALTYAKNRDMAEQVKNDIKKNGGEAISIQMYVEDRNSVESAATAVRTELGAINVLINNAAIAQEKLFDTITDDDWDRMMAVNLRGAFICCQEVLPDMRKQGFGRIVNISSIGGQWGGINQVHYAVSKAGVIALTRSLAKIYSARGITINAVAPGLVFTDMSAREIKSEKGKAKIRSIPIRRVATAEEVASAVVFLASDEASYITGQTINVNGGMLFS